MCVKVKRLIIICVYVALVSGCATRYVERDPSKKEVSDNFGDVVVSQTSEALKKTPPTCLGVLPLSVLKLEFNPTDEVRKAIHSHLAPTGVRLIPLQKIDLLYKKDLSIRDNIAALSKATGCDTYITGEVTDRKTRFWGIYSDVKIGARLQIRRADQEKPLWEGSHTAIVRDGGIPLNPISALTTAVAAGANIREEQVTRTTHDLARRLVYAIPGLAFQDVPAADIKLASNDAEPPKKTEVVSLANLKAELKGLSDSEIAVRLVDELSGDKWTSTKEREELVELLISKAPANSVGYREMAKLKLATGQSGMAVMYGKKLIQIEPDNPDNQFLLGRAYLKAEKPEEATQPLLKAAGAELPKQVYFTALGLSYTQQGKFELAVAAYKKALEFAPKDSFALLQLGMTQAFAGDEEDAAQTIRQSMISAIANNERASAEKSLNALQSLGLDNQLSSEDLRAIKERIQRL
jgi:tetratricopeptide (TPR) repeat protein